MAIIKKYKINNTDISARICLIADLHGKCGERYDEKHLGMVRLINPDIILISGDMVRCNAEWDFELLYNFIEKLAKIAPVYYVYGNHESKLFTYVPEFEEVFAKEIKNRGAVLLRNEQCMCEINGQRLSITGVDLPQRLYKRFKVHKFSKADLITLTGVPADDAFNILLVHNPAFADTYFAWGADLICSGHYHGGLVRLGDRALMGPYGFPFPKYGYGLYNRSCGNLVVTGGIGDHSIPVRIFNPHEIVDIKLEGNK